MKYFPNIIRLLVFKTYTLIKSCITLVKFELDNFLWQWQLLPLMP